MPTKIPREVSSFRRCWGYAKQGMTSAMKVGSYNGSLCPSLNRSCSSGVAYTSMATVLMTKVDHDSTI